MKRRLILTFVLALALTAQLASQTRNVTYQSLTVSTSAVALAAATLDTGNGQIKQCSGRVETADIRYRFDGTAPTSTVGVLVNAGDIVTIADAVVAKQIRFIRDTAAMADATLQIHCWR